MLIHDLEWLNEFARERVVDYIVERLAPKSEDEIEDEIEDETLATDVYRCCEWFHAYPFIDDKLVSLGLFDTPEQAEKAIEDYKQGIR